MININGLRDPAGLISSASGIKCKKAPPSIAPAESDTRAKRILFRSFSFMERVNIPSRANALTMNVARIIWASVPNIKNWKENVLIKFTLKREFFKN